MDKHEWRKKEKKTYLPKSKPEVINVPAYQYLTIEGEGNPNSELFSGCVAVLYALSYAIKMTPKKMENPPKGYFDYTVYPLEGVWDINEKAKKTFNGKVNKDDFVYKLMIRQPDFVKENFFTQMLELVKVKKPHTLLDKVKFEKIKDGKSIQMLHIGSFDTEPESFKIMETFAGNENLKRISKVHREIYLTDFRKVPEDKLKTVLRFKVE